MAKTIVAKIAMLEIDSISSAVFFMITPSKNEGQTAALKNLRGMAGEEDAMSAQLGDETYPAAPLS